MERFHRNVAILREFIASERFVKASTKDSSGSIDSFTLSLIAEDGLFLRKLTDYIALDSDNNFNAWLSIPFYSLIEHETREAMRTVFNVKFDYINTKINDIRNNSKIHSKDDAEAFIDLCKQFLQALREERGHARTPAIEVISSQRVPLGMTHQLAFEYGMDAFLKEIKENNNNAQALGADNMIASFPAYALSTLKHGKNIRISPAIQMDEAEYEIQRILQINLENDDYLGLAIRLYFSSYMCILNSLVLMLNANYINDLLFLKYSLFYLTAFSQKTKALNGYIRTNKENEYSIIMLECMLNREQRKRLKRLVFLRNALTHYDFRNWKSLSLLSPYDSFSQEIYRRSGDTLLDQLTFLKVTVLELSNRITKTLGLNHLFKFAYLINEKMDCKISDNDLAFGIKE